MREAAHSLLDGKADGHERGGCAGDGTAGARSEHQADGELLERVGGAEPRSISSRARGRSRAHPEDHRAVRASRAEGDWSFVAIRELALRSGEKWRRSDHGFRLLWRGTVAVVEGASNARLRDDPENEGGAEQQGRRRCDHRSRLSGRHGNHRGFLGLAVYQRPGGSVRAKGQLARAPQYLAVSLD